MAKDTPRDGVQNGEPRSHARPKTGGINSSGTTGQRYAPLPEPGWLGALDASRWFRPGLLVLVSAVAGGLLAPGWVTRSYPTDDSLIGQPSSADIKAAYDDRGDIEDEKTTARLRAEAVAQIRRVYDFDTTRREQIAQEVRKAFAAARQALIDSEATRPVDAARLAFESSLNVKLSDGDAAALGVLGYSESLGAVLAAALQRVSERPIVQDRAILAEDVGKGIRVRHLHDDTVRTFESLDPIGDLDSAKRRMPEEIAAAEDALSARGEGLIKPLSSSAKAALASVGATLIQPTLTFNRRDTEAARDAARLAVPPVKITVKRGQMIIRDGEVFTERHLVILRHMAKYSRDRSFVQVTLGATLLVLMLVLAGLSFGGRRRVRLGARDALFVTSLFVVFLLTARLWAALAVALQDGSTGLSAGAVLYLLPVAAWAMVARLVLRLEVAVVFAVVSSLLLGLIADGERLITAYALVGTVTGATFIGTISRRGDLLRVGLWVGGVQAITALGISLFSAQGLSLSSAATIGAALGSGILAGFVALAVTPVVEVLFRYTTDLRLLELANLNHPALKELIVQAPGTYHHSIIVGALVEAAAEAIGANALLAKVMAYYHDLGKGCNAMYFIENQRGGMNPHNKLKPSMSAMIIKRHVTDGLEVAERYALGPEIRAGIAEHHGTTLIQFFYARALEEATDDCSVLESDYRYPGRKPQSRETALVMLGDSVEAAARTLPDPTHARLQGLVNKIINTKFTDGQLEECDLTLRDLHTIARAFMQVLTSIYHQRVEYPDPGPPKKTHDDSDSKSKGAPKAAATAGVSVADPEDRPDNIRRLGLS